jgi:hypothetical protein
MSHVEPESVRVGLTGSIISFEIFLSRRRLIKNAGMRVPRVLRSLFKPLQTRSIKTPESRSEKLVSSSEKESVIRLRGKKVEWRGKPLFRYPVDIRIKKNAQKHDTRSVHAAVNTPGEKLVAFYRGRVLPCPSGLTKISGKWFIALPGCRGLYVLDSQITDDWPWERYLKEEAVAGFFNSSQPFACKDPRRRGVGNPFDANCRLVWYKESYGPEDTLGANVYAAMFTTEPVRAGKQFLWNYPWV